MQVCTHIYEVSYNNITLMFVFVNVLVSLNGYSTPMCLILQWVF